MIMENNKLTIITNKLTTQGFYNIHSLKEATDLFNSLDIANANIEKARAWILYKVSVDKLYTNTQYNGVGAYAKDKFGFTKGNTSMYVKGAKFLESPVSSIFASIDEVTGVMKDFSITQLSVLATLEEPAVWELINSGKINYKTTVNELKKIVNPDKAKKESEKAERENSSVAEIDTVEYVDTIVNGTAKADKTFKKNTLYSFTDIEEIVAKYVKAWNVGKEKVFMFTYDIETNEIKVHQFTKNNK